jgi:DNA repair protein RadC
MPRIHDLPFNERPREKAIQNGIQSLSNAELIAILLRTGTKSHSALELSIDVLSICNGLKGLADTTLAQLVSIKGIQPSKALTLLSAAELAKRIIVDRNEYEVGQSQIQNVEQAIQIWMSKLKGSLQEELVLLALNTKMRLITSKTLFVGSVDSHMIHPRDIFREAIRNNSSKIILMHNHPTGDPEPSPSDVETTQQIAELGNELGIKLMDHIILGSGRYVSMKQRGLL